MVRILNEIAESEDDPTCLRLRYVGDKENSCGHAQQQQQQRRAGYISPSPSVANSQNGQDSLGVRAFAFLVKR